jgi:cytochrome c oxidase cbb3-type subunit 3
MSRSPQDTGAARGALRLTHGLTLGASFCAALFALTACGKKSEDVREWRATDHDRADASAGQAAPPSAPQGAVHGAPQGAPPSLQEYGISDVVLATWKTNCTPCHGIIGRGDGPQGAMVRPPDFTHPVWQKAALDDQMQHSIKKGKGRMPPFPQLPDDTVAGLVKLIRLLNSDRSQAPAPAGAASAAPASPVAPGASVAPAPPATPTPVPAAPTAPRTAPSPAASPSPGTAPSHP